VPIGAPGAGKTTWLDGLAAELDDPGFRYGPDDVRAAAFGTLAYQGVGHLVHASARYCFAARIASGRAAGYDATNSTRSERKPLVEIARKYFGTPIAVVFPCGLDVLLARNAARDRPDAVVPEDVIERYARRVAAITEDRLRDEGFTDVWWR
jgi:predicted kinase